MISSDGFTSFSLFNNSIANYLVYCVALGIAFAPRQFVIVNSAIFIKGNWAELFKVINFVNNYKISCIYFPL